MYFKNHDCFFSVQMSLMVLCVMYYDTGMLIIKIKGNLGKC